MAIHLDRNNMLFGTGSPMGIKSPDFYGQTYIDTGANPRQLWMSTGQFASSWVQLPSEGHGHSFEDIDGLREEVKNIVDEEGIEAALIALLSASNTWEGPFNNFTGSLRKDGVEVLSQRSSIDELADVKTEGKEVNSLLGWNGSHYIPYEVKGASPGGEGEIDFGQYVRKDQIVDDLGSTAVDAPLAAAAAKRILETVKAKYSAVGHVHTEYAPTNHTHTNYADLTKNISFEHQLNIGSKGNLNPVNMINDYTKIGFYNAENENDYAKMTFSKIGGGLGKAMISGEDGSAGEELVLNFSKISIPTGGFSIAENKKYLAMPPLKVASQGGGFIGFGNTRNFALDAGNNPIVGASQIAFKEPSRNNTDSLLFPKNYAGNTQPSDLGYYHYLRLADGELKTDTALASESDYISLGGRKIFFTPTDPGKRAKEGDLWFAV